MPRQGLAQPIVAAALLLVATAPSMAVELVIELHPIKRTFALGEPVMITARVTNNGAEAVRLMYHNAPTVVRVEDSLVDLMLGQSELQLRRWSDDLRDAIRAAPRELPPRETVTVDLVMLFNREHGFFATHPGRYWIQARIIEIGVGEMFSEPVPIEIRRPSFLEQPMWEWLDTHKEEYGRLVQVPWAAELSHDFLLETGRRSETSTSVYSEYLGLFLSRAYRDGPKKDANLSTHFAEIAKAGAKSEKIRSEAEKILNTKPRITPPVAPPPKFAHEVDAATQRAVAESLDRFAAALTAGRMDECAALLSHDFLYNSRLDKARALANFEDDLSESPGVVISIVVDSVSGDVAGDEVEVSGRLVAKMPGRQVREHQTRWVLRRQAASWVIARSDRIPPPSDPPPAPPRVGP